VIPVKKRRTKKKEPHLIPVLFTLGVIGWGFFAIDRITRPESGDESVRDTSRERRELPEWRRKFSDYLDSLTDTRKKLVEVDSLDAAGDELPVVEEKFLNFQSEKSVRDATVTIKMFSLDNQGDPVLVPVQRRLKLEDENSVFPVFSAILEGPDSSEQASGFIDAFTDKPRLISARQSGEILTLDFSREFGSRTSRHIFIYQLQQLLANGKMFPGVQRIKILIEGKSVSHLGGDGFHLPEIIDETTISRLQE